MDRHFRFNIDWFSK